MAVRSLNVADLAGRRVRGPAWRNGLAFAAAAVVVTAGFVTAGAVMHRFAVWQAESFGDRRLASPGASECEIARVLLKDHRGVGGGERTLQLRAFAWRSTGARIPGQGVDWRKCRGLGAYVRSLGMAPLGSGGTGPWLYVSRPIFRDGPSKALVYGAVSPREDLQGGARVRRAWQVELRRNPRNGAWTVVRRAAIDAD